MAFILDSVRNINTLINKHQDLRTADWPFMSSPFYTLGLCFSYVLIVKYLGPKFMENRKPFELRNILIAYNFFQVLFSIFLFYEIGMGGWFYEYSFRCQPVDYSNKPSTLRMVRASWWYYISKFSEFFDTFFFVLRKKFDHISTLHVLHHGIMPMSVWFGVKFTPGGHSTFFGFLNTFVHIIMYFYYMLSAIGPSVYKYLWWKKYLTTLQMVQFVGIMVHAFQLLFVECNYPRAFVWWIGMHAVMFFFLFKEFYTQTYTKTMSKLKSKNNTELINGKQQNGGIISNEKLEQNDKLINSSKLIHNNKSQNGIANGNSDINKSDHNGTILNSHHTNGNLHHRIKS